MLNLRGLIIELGLCPKLIAAVLSGEMGQSIALMVQWDLSFINHILIPLFIKDMKQYDKDIKNYEFCVVGTFELFFIFLNFKISF